LNSRLTFVLAFPLSSSVKHCCRNESRSSDMRIVLAVLIALFAIAPATAGPGDDSSGCTKRTQIHTS
jgi:hypothetical protein